MCRVRARTLASCVEQQAVLDGWADPGCREGALGCGVGSDWWVQMQRKQIIGIPYRQPLLHFPREIHPLLHNRFSFSLPHDCRFGQKFLHLAFFSLPVFQLLTTLTMDSVTISQLCPGPNLLSRLLATLSNVGAWGFRPPALNSSEGFSFPWVISSR